MEDTTDNLIKVLIVDDDYYVNLDILSYHLRRIGGYEPLNAFNVEQFRELAPKADIVILDIRLPDKDGAQINPWGGLRALNEMLGKPETPKCLSRVIIRSVQSEGDAKRAGENIPPYHCWLSVDTPLTRLMGELKELTLKIQESGRYHI